jgi:hypothetical protein
MRSMKKWLLASLALTAMMAIAGARDAEAQARNRRKLIRLETVKVEGRIQKPQAFYILQRSNLNFEGLELKNSFVPKIIKSVEAAPF